MHIVSFLSNIVITYLCILHRCRCVDSDYGADTSDEYSVNDEPRVSLPKNVENAVLTFPLQHFLSEGHGHALQGEFRSTAHANSIPEEVLESIVSDIVNNNKRIFRISLMNDERSNSQPVTGSRLSNQYDDAQFDRSKQNGYLGQGLKNFAAYVTRLKHEKNTPKKRPPKKSMISSVKGNQIENRKTKQPTKKVIFDGDIYKFYEPIFGYQKANVYTHFDLYDLLTSLPLYEGPIEKLDEMQIFTPY